MICIDFCLFIMFYDLQESILSDYQIAYFTTFSGHFSFSANILTLKITFVLDFVFES